MTDSLYWLKPTFLTGRTMKPDLYKIHILITILYLGVGLIIGTGFVAFSYSYGNASIEWRWIIYPFITVLLVLGFILLRVNSISTKPDLIKFVIFAVSSLSLVISWCVVTESVDFISLGYSCFTLFLIAKAVMARGTPH